MNDLISREAAIEKILDIYKTWGIYEEDEENTEVLRAIKRLPSAQQWIPCSERLPDEEGYYMITRITNETAETGEYYYDKEKNEWYFPLDGGGLCWANNVIAWQPLPEPYVEGENESYKS